MHNKTIDVVEYTKANGGGTFDWNGRFLLASHKTGFYVATNTSINVPINEFELQLDFFLEDNGINLRGKYLGTWIDEGKVFIEITDHFGGRIEALEVAKERDQIAIWDIANNCEIRIK